MPRRAFLFSAGLAVAVLAGCQSVSTLKQRCLSGEVAACEKACVKAVAGEGGCFHAGNLHRERAALDYAGSEFKRASEYFLKSCEGGFAEGCLLSAELIEAPYAPDLAVSASATLPTITDAEVMTREKRLERACSLGSKGGCKRLGDVLIGKATDRAKVAYAKACKESSAPAECTTARDGEADQAERWRAGCVGLIAQDCTHLGDLLYQVDPPRAVRLFMSECQLRQVADLVGGVGQFVHDRIAEARFAAAPAKPPAPPANGAPILFDAVSPVVKGPLAVTEVLHEFAQHAAELSTCFDPATKPMPEVPLELIVDATGAVFRAGVSGNAPPEAAKCLQSVLLGLGFQRPQTAAVVTLTLRPRATP